MTQWMVARSAVVGSLIAIVPIHSFASPPPQILEAIRYYTVPGELYPAVVAGPTCGIDQDHLSLAVQSIFNEEGINPEYTSAAVVLKISAYCTPQGDEFLYDIDVRFLGPKPFGVVGA